MKLYYAPGACSLADHIALREAGVEPALDKVDLKAKTTQSGADYAAINPKGYVPALELDDGQVLTENIAILSWIAGEHSELAPHGPLCDIRLLEALAFISTEVHKSFKPFFKPDSTDAEKAAAADIIDKRMRLLDDHMDGDYLFGDRFTVADAYLFVMLTWAKKNGLALPGRLPAYFDRVRARDAVGAALAAEGIG